MFLQGILVGLLAVIVLALLMAAIMEKKYSLSASTLINRPKNEVFDYVKHLKNQENYSKWVMQDPNVRMTYTGVDGTIGFKSAWVSEDKNVGVGEQEITKINDSNSYDVEIRFEKPFKGVSTAQTTTETVSENQTKVTNTFYTTTPFPMNLMVPIIKKMLQKDLELNMATLKKVLED